ncbi:unnamed protein product [Heterobilharzia americana]|nr:unnamed protein product [Heterobilharzia americana]
MKMFPNPPYIQDDILINIIYLLPQIMILTWILSVILSVKYMVDEKENGLIDFLSTFGINLSINWLAWISISFILMSFFSIPIVLILKYCKIIPLSNIIIIYFLIINYTIACLIYCIIFTILSKRATIASIIAGITYLLLYMPAAIILRYDELMNDNWILLFCLIPQVSHALSWVFINRLELHGSGAQWSNIWNTNYSQSILTLGTTIIFLWIGIILLYCLTFWGIPLINRIYALFIYKYLFNKNYSNHTISMKGVKRRRKRKLSNIALYNDTLSTDSSQLLVNNTQGNISTSIIQSPSVIVDNLCKIYEPINRAALCNVNMNFYEDQITVILGRNGAGKTTLLSILVGILQPTDGRIIMHGKETHKYSHILRQILGYCPQYNILYDSLTVTEHIYLFGTLKGVNNNTLNDNMNDYLCKLGLFDKRNELACRLSGGQRRNYHYF